VKSSCEFGIEVSGSIKCWEAIECPKTLAKRHIVVGHFVRSDTGHVMQAIDVTRH
jgi:hypothetical protein